MTIDTAVADLSLVDALAHIAARKVSSGEVTSACLDRLQNAGLQFNCAVDINRKAALCSAEKADNELNCRKPHRSLHGIPLAHKDMFYRTGRVSACGSRILADFVPNYTATVLRRLDRAGAVDLGRLHMSEMALGSTGHNDFLGVARNPWDPSRAPGGSSSGSAIAVACRAAYGALGSDTGGSVRQPAAFCGIVGFKPTAGRISRHGMMPLSFTIDSVGILARSVADCWLIFSMLAGHDQCDPATVRHRVPQLPEQVGGSLSGVRIGVLKNYVHDGTDDDVSSRAADSLVVLKDAGATIVSVDFPSVGLASPMLGIIVAVEAAALHLTSLQGRPQDFGRQTRARLNAGLLYPGTSYVQALTLRAKILAELQERVFDRVDVIHTPTMPMTAPTLADSDVKDRHGFAEYLGRYGHYTRPASYGGLPAITVPAGNGNNGMPCGFQLMGRPFDDATVLQVAAAYEREAGPFPHPPSVPPGAKSP